MTYKFIVYGEPQQWRVKRTREGRHYPDPVMQKWQESVRMQAIAALKGKPLWNEAVRLDMVFYQLRPKSHFKSNGELSAKGKRTPYPTGTPDRINLGKCAEDALKGVVYVDDKQTVMGRTDKFYGDPPRVEIEVELMAVA